MSTEARYRWTMLPHAMSRAFADLQERSRACHEPRVKITTGLRPLDAALGPLLAGELVLVAGSEPTLRGSFLLRCALGCSERDLVAVLCLGQPSSRASVLMIAGEARVPLALLDRGQLDRSRHWPAVADAVEQHHQRYMALLDLEEPTPQALRTALRELRREYGGIALVVVDAVEPIAGEGRSTLTALAEAAREQGAPVLVGALPATVQEARAAGLASAVIHLPEVGDEALSAMDAWTLPVRVAADRAGGSTTLRLSYDPHCCAWDVPVPQPAGVVTEGKIDEVPVSRREGKELDEVYSAACCALLHEVGLAHYWDGQPHGPGRAWDLPNDERLSDEQRLVVRVALDIWDNQGGVLLRDLRKLPAGMVADVGELIADTDSWRGPASWVERHLGQDWQHWMAEGRWEQLLGVGWREVLGRG
jgi:hypothetical protein